MATKKTDSKAEGQTGSSAAKSGGAGKGGSASKGTSAQKSAPAASKGTSAEKGIAAKQARSTAAAGGSGSKSSSKSSSKGASKSSSGRTELGGVVRGFVSGRPQGWNHDEWLGFLEDLRSRGHNVEDRDSIGSMLERERLAQALAKVPGIGAQRVQAIAERFGNLWRLKDAGAEELAREANIPRPLAERIADSVR
jgi:hypothetical protein